MKAEKIAALVVNQLDCAHLKSLAIGSLRYEALRKLSPRQYAELYQRNLKGENFDAMVDALIENPLEHK